MIKNTIITIVLFSSTTWATTQTGINTSNPTATLGTTGNKRVRTITPAIGSTIVTPVYPDTHAFLVKASPSVYYRGVTSNSVAIASDTTGILITVTAEDIYKVVVINTNACMHLDIVAKKTTLQHNKI